MNLPTKIRYRRYEDWSDEEKQNIQKKVSASPWHAIYHVEPRTGLLNDPNGFCFFDGRYHLFYQNWPFGPAHGLKSWVDTVSDDLVHFTETGIKLLPDHKNDFQGAYTGSAVQIGDRLFIMYTGNVRDENWVRHPKQVGAWMDKDGKIEKFEDVLIEQPKDVTEHFRDPMLFQVDGQLFVIIGAQSLDKKGFTKIYRAQDNDVHHWVEVGNLDDGGLRTEYMDECPNLLFVDGHPVLIYSPQGLDQKELQYRNIYPNAYRICKAFDTKKPALIEPSEIRNFDYGFETYATQGFNAPNGKVYAVSWIGLPDIDSPTDAYDYQGAMTLVKELSVKDGKLIQYPVPAMKTLRKAEHPFASVSETSNAYELELKIPAEETAVFNLFDDGQNGLRITVDPKAGALTVDRSQIGEQYALEYGTSRTCPLAHEETTLNIFVDRSIFEIYVNKGEAALTGRVFPTKGQSGIRVLSGTVAGTRFDFK
ncbi:sucrose-6-phosphate hydrolase [Catenisphaera adipataccumulans]|uniref:Sucrose-6-phosphate hydrolase n=1 Tax=Catenisphaera adipataccumulans TaxID=700500 RepID=A0A7W8CVJ2_9FIRM|nr:sucrose-6-phosphate hydrolase [Catenisphaera adipataccumulans]MBB5182368.1 beta-fructofuranosidase [Catenisphaera adipataccumulans]